MNTLNEIARRAHETAKAKGFWSDIAVENMTPVVVQKLLLIHTEVSEAAEEVRTRGTCEHTGEGGKPEGLPSELADVLIRTLDLAVALGIDVDDVVQRKMYYNDSRPHLHGGKRF